MNDPIVNEIREIRHRHAEKFNFDLDAIVEDIISKRPIMEEMMTAYRKGNNKTAEALRQKLQI